MVSCTMMDYSLFLMDIQFVSYFLYYQQCCNECSYICLPTHMCTSLFICLEVQLWVTKQHFCTFMLLPNLSPENCLALALSAGIHESFLLPHPHPIFSTTWHVKALNLGQFEDEMTSFYCVTFSLIPGKTEYILMCLGTMWISHTVNCLFTDFTLFSLLGCLILLICRHVF